MRAARLQELVSGGQYRHDRTPYHRDRLISEGCQHAYFGRPEDGALRENDLASGDVLRRRPDVGAGLDRRVDRDFGEVGAGLPTCRLFWKCSTS